MIYARKSHGSLRAQRTDRDSDKEVRANICVHEVARLLCKMTALTNVSHEYSTKLARQTGPTQA
jgi:hypothetical protein